MAELVFGDLADVPGVREQWGRIQSSLAGPAMAALLWQTYLQDDVRDLLDSVSVPTLVMARPGDHMVPYEAQAACSRPAFRTPNSSPFRRANTVPSTLSMSSSTQC